MHASVVVCSLCVPCALCLLYDSRQVISRSSSVTGSNVGATHETDEPLLDGADSAAGRSVWYSWTPSVTGSYFVTAAGSSFDTVMGVYKADDKLAGLTNVSASNVYKVL